MRRFPKGLVDDSVATGISAQQVCTRLVCVIQGTGGLSGGGEGWGYVCEGGGGGSLHSSSTKAVDSGGPSLTTHAGVSPRGSGRVRCIIPHHQATVQRLGVPSFGGRGGPKF